MKYSLANPSEAERAQDYLTQLMKGKKTVEIKLVSPRRSLSQNSYLHLLLSAYGQHFGYTLDEAKELYKRMNTIIYGYEKNGQMFYRSSADLESADMARSIDRFRQHSAEQGYPLPTAEDKAWLSELDKIIEQSKHYL